MIGNKLELEGNVQIYDASEKIGVCSNRQIVVLWEWGRRSKIAKKTSYDI